MADPILDQYRATDGEVWPFFWIEQSGVFKQNHGFVSIMILPVEWDGEHVGVPVRYDFDHDLQAFSISTYFGRQFSPETVSGLIRYCLKWISNDPLEKFYRGSTEELKSYGFAPPEAVSMRIEVNFEGLDEAMRLDNYTCNAFLVYCDFLVTPDCMSEIRKLSEEIDKAIFVRDVRYAKNKRDLTKPIAFISHDSRDKEAIAEPLALALTKALGKIWYDKFSLLPGDRLRQSIESGLNECEKCVVILSQNFFSNKGWPASEFDGIFARELAEKRDLIIPVWFDVSQSDVVAYSPIIANRVAVIWENNVDVIANKIVAALSKK